MGSIYFGGPMDYNMAVYNVYAKIAENPVGQLIIDVPLTIEPQPV